MAEIHIAEGKGVLELTDGILRLRWKAGKTIGAADALTATWHVHDLCRENSYPMLIHVEGVNFSKSARTVFASPSVASRVALLGSSPVDHVMALFLLRLQPAACPTMYFTSLRKATSWLRGDESQRKPQRRKKIDSP